MTATEQTFPTPFFFFEKNRTPIIYQKISETLNLDIPTKFFCVK